MMSARTRLCTNRSARCYKAKTQEGFLDRRLRVLAILTQKLKKAAPRFELGVEVLQTSALPLGYAAVTSEI